MLVQHLGIVIALDDIGKWATTKEVQQHLPQILCGHGARWIIKALNALHGHGLCERDGGGPRVSARWRISATGRKKAIEYMEALASLYFAEED